MLKALTSSCLNARSYTKTLHSKLRHGVESSNSPLLRLLDSLRGDSNRINPNFCKRAFFCSDSTTDGSEEAAAEVKKAEVEEASKSSSAIVPTVIKPDDYLTVYI